MAEGFSFEDEIDIEAQARARAKLALEPSFAAPPEESFTTRAAKNIGGMGLSVLDAMTFGFGDEAVAGGAAALQKLYGTEDFGPAYEGYLNRARSTLRGFREEHPVAAFGGTVAGALGSPVKAAVKGTTFAGKLAADALTGAGYGATYGLGSGEGGLAERAQSAKESGILGGVGGALISPIAQGIGWAARQAAGPVADKLERAGFGIGKREINKSLKQAKIRGDAISDEPEPIYAALKEFREQGGGKLRSGLSADDLVTARQAQEDALEGELAERLTSASAIQQEPLIPKFKNTERYLERLGILDKNKAREYADSVTSQFLDSPDIGSGTLLDWQKQKVLLGKSIRASYGREQNPIQQTILQKVRQDIKEAIEDKYSQIIQGQERKTASRAAPEVTDYDPRSAGEWIKTDDGQVIFSPRRRLLPEQMPPQARPSELMAGLEQVPTRRRIQGANLTNPNADTGGAIRSLNERLGRSYDLEPVFRDLQAGDRAGSIDKALKQTIRTSGGIGVPLITGAVTGNPALALGGLALAGLGTRPGRILSADVLRAAGPGVQGGASFARDVIPKLLVTGSEAVNADVPSEDTDLMKNQGINDDIMRALISVESGGNPNAVSPKGARGLAQLMPATAEEEAEKLGLEYDPDDDDQNVLLGRSYLERQYRKYGNLELALAAYNAGPGRLDRAIAKAGSADFETVKKFLPEETRNYVPKVISRMKVA